MRMTLANESITITPQGVWIQPVLSSRFRFSGSIVELFSILVYHTELDIDHARFYVRDEPQIHTCPICGPECTC